MRRTLAGVAMMAWLLLAAAPAVADHRVSTGINCLTHFSFQEEAQAYFEAHPGDPEGLDGPPGPAFAGVQGVACEELPRRGPTQVAAVAGYPPGPVAVPTGPAFVVVQSPTAAPAAVPLARTGQDFSRWFLSAGAAIVMGAVFLAIARRKTAR